MACQLPRHWEKFPYKRDIEDADGSCMIVVATDAPVNARNLKRMASRAMLGLAKTGGFASNGSGDYVIAFSVYPENLEGYRPFKRVKSKHEVENDFYVTSFFGCRGSHRRGYSQCAVLRPQPSLDMMGPKRWNSLCQR